MNNCSSPTWIPQLILVADSELQNGLALWALVRKHIETQKATPFSGSESATEIGVGIWSEMSRLPGPSSCQNPSLSALPTKTFTHIAVVAACN